VLCLPQQFDRTMIYITVVPDMEARQNISGLPVGKPPLVGLPNRFKGMRVFNAIWRSLAESDSCEQSKSLPVILV
jgi:hypothetical protein